MTIIFVPINKDREYDLEQQTKIINDLMKKGWKHLGYTLLKDKAGEDITAAILFADFLWMGECDGVEKPEIGREENTRVGPRYADKTVKVPVCPRCGCELEEERNPDARTMYHFKCKCGYTY